MGEYYDDETKKFSGEGQETDDPPEKKVGE